MDYNHHVLEIACGTGIITLGIADKVKKVTGVDISPIMISVAKEKVKRLSITNVELKVEMDIQWVMIIMLLM